MRELWRRETPLTTRACQKGPNPIATSLAAWRAVRRRASRNIVATVRKPPNCSEAAVQRRARGASQHANARAESAYVLARRAGSQHFAHLHIPFFTLDAVIELVPTGRLWQCIFPDLAAEDEATAAAEGDAAGTGAVPADGAPAQTAGGPAQGTRQRGRGTASPPSGAAPPLHRGRPLQTHRYSMTVARPQDQWQWSPTGAVGSRPGDHAWASSADAAPYPQPTP